MRESLTAIVERNITWRGKFSTEPQECAWATEAIFFVRALGMKGANESDSARASVQISPDGIHWCNEGTILPLPTEADPITFCRVRQFGGYLRLAGQLPIGCALTVIVYLALKE